MAASAVPKTRPMARTRKPVLTSVTKELCTHPDVDKWFDPEDGDCILTMDTCDCPSKYKSYSCNRCPRSMTAYISELVKHKIPLTGRKEIWRNTGYKFVRNEEATVAMCKTTEPPEKLFTNVWWFPHLMDFDPCSWETELEFHECPHAFALSILMKDHELKRLMWAPGLICIMVYDDRVYAVSGTLKDGMDSDETRAWYEGGAEQ